MVTSESDEVLAKHSVRDPKSLSVRPGAMTSWMIASSFSGAHRLPLHEPANPLDHLVRPFPVGSDVAEHLT